MDLCVIYCFAFEKKSKKENRSLSRRVHVDQRPHRFGEQRHVEASADALERVEHLQKVRRRLQQLELAGARAELRQVLSLDLQHSQQHSHDEHSIEGASSSTHSNTMKRYRSTLKFPVSNEQSAA